MSKPKWTKTPFETVEQAQAFAKRMGLRPGEITEGLEFRSFQIWEGRTLTLVAQRVLFSGELSGPVLEKVTPKAKALPQDPGAPRWGEDDRLLTNPWMDSDYASLEEVRVHLENLGPSWKGKYTFYGKLLVVQYPDKDVYEYRKAQSGTVVQMRVSFSAKGRYLEAYKKIHTDPWALSDFATLEDVEGHWRKQFINSDNIEVLDVKLYRIEGDEYEYCEDSEGVWSRVLEKKK